MASTSLPSLKGNLNQSNKGLSKHAKDCSEENFILLTKYSGHI